MEETLEKFSLVLHARRIQSISRWTLQEYFHAATALGELSVTRSSVSRLRSINRRVNAASFHRVSNNNNKKRLRLPLSLSRHLGVLETITTLDTVFYLQQNYSFTRAWRTISRQVWKELENIFFSFFFSPPGHASKITVKANSLKYVRTTSARAARNFWMIEGEKNSQKSGSAFERSRKRDKTFTRK